jgi:hypothetical protein
MSQDDTSVVVQHPRAEITIDDAKSRIRRAEAGTVQGSGPRHANSHHAAQSQKLDLLITAQR